MNKISFTTLIFSLLSFTLYAQDNTSSFDTLMQQSNKMIAVIIVLVIILLGIAGFLFYLDKKISKLENQIKSK